MWHARGRQRLAPLQFLAIVASLTLAPRASAVVPPEANTTSDSPSPRAAAPPATNRLVVKFKHEGGQALTACAHCLLAQRKAFRSASADGSDSLDRLNQRFGVRAVRPLFRASQRESDTVRSAAPGSLAAAKQALRGRLLRAQQRRPSAAHVRQEQLPELSHIYLVELPEGADAHAAAQAYAQDPHVLYAQPDYPARVQWVPNDPFYASTGSWGQAEDDLWGLKRINTEAAWDVTQGQGVVVAVVDTGVDDQHPDLEANIWVNAADPLGDVPDACDRVADPTIELADDDCNGFTDDVSGWDFTTCALIGLGGVCGEPKAPGNNPHDAYGHGTHVAGTIAAVGNNGQGVIGVAPLARILRVKGLNDDGGGVSSDLANAIVYAAQTGAMVINNSWGCSPQCLGNPVVEDAVRTAHSLGATVVFAAGNSAVDVATSSPQNMTDPKPLVVGATQPSDQATYFTNVGFLVDVAAPGGGADVSPPSYEPVRNILSLKAGVTNPEMDGEGQLIVGQDYVRQAGTSMAAPHAAGVAALVHAHRPGISPDAVRQILFASADDVGAPGIDVQTGAGRLNAAAALAVDPLSLPQVDLSTPARWDVFSPLAETVTISGTADGPGLAEFALSYGRGLAPTVMEAIGTSMPAPVVNGPLGTWTIQGLPEDFYTLRLVGTTIAGKQFHDLVHVVMERFPPQPMTTDPSEQRRPAASGDRMVWEDYRHGNAEIYLYDLATQTERRLTTLSGLQMAPAIAGDRVVWEDYRHGNAEIYLYDLATETERRLTNDPGKQLRPAIAGDRVVWMDLRNGNWDVYLYDLATETEHQLTTDPADQSWPAISGDRVVWEDRRNGYDDIYLYDLTTQTERRLTTDVTQHNTPDIDGDRVVWTDSYLNLHLYDLSTETQRQLTSDAAYQTWPAIVGTKVVWVDNRNGNSDIYLYDLATETERQVTWNFARQTLPAVSQNWVAWEDERNGAGDIYMKPTNSPPALDPLTNKSIAAGKLLVFPVSATDPDNELLTFAAPQRPTGSTILPKGDVTQDGARSAADADVIAACVAQTSTCTWAQIKLGDVAGPQGLQPDGKLTAEDTQTVTHMLEELAIRGQHPEVVPILNTAMFLWQTTAADGDEAPYTVQLQAGDAGGATNQATIAVTVNSASANLLANGGFESGGVGWVGWGGGESVTASTAYTGTMALQFDLGGQMREVRHDLVDAIPGALYVARASVRTAIPGGAQAQVQVSWRKANGAVLRTDVFALTGGVTDWTRHSSPVLTAPAQTAKVRVDLVAGTGSGQVFFDAVRLEQKK